MVLKFFVFFRNHTIMQQGSGLAQRAAFTCSQSGRLTGDGGCHKDLGPPPTKVKLHWGPVSQVPTRLSHPCHARCNLHCATRVWPSVANAQIWRRLDSLQPKMTSSGQWTCEGDNNIMVLERGRGIWDKKKANFQNQGVRDSAAMSSRYPVCKYCARLTLQISLWLECNKSCPSARFPRSVFARHSDGTFM